MGTAKEKGKTVKPKDLICCDGLTEANSQLLPQPLVCYNLPCGIAEKIGKVKGRKIMG